MWIFLNFVPIGWPQLDAVYEHGLAYARSKEFYDTTLFWQWMRMPGDIVFALGALLMAWDFLVKLRPILPIFGTSESSKSSVALTMGAGGD
jgi:nitric oxide reductase subunit B